MIATTTQGCSKKVSQLSLAGLDGGGRWWWLYYSTRSTLLRGFSENNTKRRAARDYQRVILCARFTTGATFADHLELPTILYADNHLLAVQKPAGWHSVPNHPTTDRRSHHNKRGSSSSSSSKCLLSYCQEQKWGGGSAGRFLLPMHRLDQPCTGVLLLGKTSKAARRIQSQWDKVQKTYLCVVHKAHLNDLIAASARITSSNNKAVVITGTNITRRNDIQQSLLKYQISGTLLQKDKKTVRMIPISSSSQKENNPQAYFCSLTWHVLASSSSFVILNVKTDQGRRHMIRALLGQVGSCPIVGDLRYNNNNNNNESAGSNTYRYHSSPQQRQPIKAAAAAQPLPDGSVALHAAQIILPLTLRLGITPNEQEEIQGGLDGKTNSSALAGLAITAPTPSDWETFFPSLLPDEYDL